MKKNKFIKAILLGTLANSFVYASGISVGGFYEKPVNVNCETIEFKQNPIQTICYKPSFPDNIQGLVATAPTELHDLDSINLDSNFKINSARLKNNIGKLVFNENEFLTKIECYNSKPTILFERNSKESNSLLFSTLRDTPQAFYEIQVGCVLGEEINFDSNRDIINAGHSTINYFATANGHSMRNSFAFGKHSMIRCKQREFFDLPNLELYPTRFVKRAVILSYEEHTEFLKFKSVSGKITRLHHSDLVNFDEQGLVINVEKNFCNELEVNNEK